MERISDHLQMDLPAGYQLLRSSDDDGEEVFKAAYGVSKDDKGEDVYEFSVQILALDSEDNALFTSDYQDEDDGSLLNKVSLGGNTENMIRTYQKDVVLIVKFHLSKMLAAFRRNGKSCVLAWNRFLSDSSLEEELGKQVDHLNAVIGAIVIDGERVRVEPLTTGLFLTTDAAGKKTPDNARFPVGTPGAEQHPHIDFLGKSKGIAGLLGGLVQINQTGTEYSFEKLEEFVDRTSDNTLAAAVDRVVSLSGDFPLSEKAKEFAQLFRVTPEAFNESEDREQEILSGFLRRATHFEVLRSFIWTMKRHCGQKGISPDQIPLDEIFDMIDFISGRDWLNYAEDGEKGFCDGPDIHNFFLPDAVGASDRKKICSAVEESDGQILSLEAIRRELTFVFPAVEKIYQELQYDRDRSCPLVSDEADVLYAWCSAAYAARTPFYTEDGPVNCIYEHPEVEPLWEREERKRREQKYANWMKKYGDLITKRPRIQFNGKLFVFSGVERGDDWPDILQALRNRGGVERGSVTGKTDYLVVDPEESGESKIRAVKEQKVKGHIVTVVLAEDFFAALGIRKKKPEEKPVPVSGMPAPKRERSEKNEKQNPFLLSFSNGKRVEAEGYSIAIPDGFAVAKDPGERAYVLYRADGLAPDGDYMDADFQIMDGSVIKSEDVKTFQTAEEFTALGRLFFSKSTGLMDMIHSGLNDVWPYPGEKAPGCINFIWNDGCLHINALLGMMGGVQMIRLQITDVRKRDVPYYREVVSALFDTVTPKEPIRFARHPYDEAWRSAVLTKDMLTEWKGCIADYSGHLQTAFALLHKTLENDIENKNSGASASPFELKNMIRRNLTERVVMWEHFVERVFSVYEDICKNNAGNMLLMELRDVVAKLTETRKMTITLNEDEKITVPAPSVEEISKKLDTAEIKALRDREQEEAKRREAEARAAAKEKERQQREAKEEYEKVKARWQEDVRKAEEARKEELARRREARRRELEAAFEKTFGAEKAAANQALAAAQEKKKQAERALASLGAFRFSEKKAQKALLDEAEAEIAGFSQMLTAAAQKRDKAAAAMTEQLEAYTAEQAADVEKRFPLPPQPSKPASMLAAERAEQEAREREEREAKEKEGKLIDKIISLLFNNWLTLNELADKVPETMRPKTTSELSKYLSSLYNIGAVNRMKENGKTYYSSVYFTRSLQPREDPKNDPAIMKSIMTNISSYGWYNLYVIKNIVPELKNDDEMEKTARLCRKLALQGKLMELVEKRELLYAKRD